MEFREQEEPVPVLREKQVLSGATRKVRELP